MSTVTIVLLVILVILIGVLIGLYFFGKNGINIRDLGQWAWRISGSISLITFFNVKNIEMSKEWPTQRIFIFDK